METKKEPPVTQEFWEMMKETHTPLYMNLYTPELLQARADREYKEQQKKNKHG